MSKPGARRSKRFPWLLLVLLLGSIYAFWILPRQLGPRPIRVEYERPPIQNP